MVYFLPQYHIFSGNATDGIEKANAGILMLHHGRRRK
jgi:hypothetical protein